jgi:hypothetical protein
LQDGFTGLIENVSARIHIFAWSSCAEALPIKAGDKPAKWIVFLVGGGSWHVFGD